MRVHLAVTLVSFVLVVVGLSADVFYAVMIGVVGMLGSVVYSDVFGTGITL